jgi:hypothetical protein
MDVPAQLLHIRDCHLSFFCGFFYKSAAEPEGLVQPNSLSWRIPLAQRHALRLAPAAERLMASSSPAARGMQSVSALARSTNVCRGTTLSLKKLRVLQSKCSAVRSWSFHISSTFCRFSYFSSPAFRLMERS